MQHVTAQGVEVPVLGLGTAGMTGTECREAVEIGLECGYRHLDTAQMYDNEDAVGAALGESAVGRNEVFVTTKINTGNHRYDDVLESVANSCNRLETEYIDLLLIHSPSETVPVEETIEAMNHLQEERAVEHIGVSNFSVREVAEAVAASETPIITNQVKYHPFRAQSELLEYCVENDIMLTAYSPLARGKVANDDTLSEIGAQYEKTASQVALRWLIQQRVVSAIPKASSRDHLEENLDIFDFELSSEEIERIFDQQGGLLDRVRSALGL